MFSYPLILSIENHCHVEQQKQMAQIMKTVFGSILLLQEFEISIGKIANNKIFVNFCRFDRVPTRVILLSLFFFLMNKRNNLILK